MPKITEFEVIDHGIDGAQYFPGCGTAFTNFGCVATGCGDTFAEAIEDALEMMAQGQETSGADFEALEREIALEGFGTVQQDGKVTWEKSESAFVEARKANGELTDEEWEEASDECDVYYYVSIRYNVSADGAVEVKNTSPACPVCHEAGGNYYCTSCGRTATGKVAN